MAEYRSSPDGQVVASQLSSPLTCRIVSASNNSLDLCVGASAPTECSRTRPELTRATGVAMAHAAGKRTRAAAPSHVESPERTANLGAGGRVVSLAIWRWHRAKAAQDTADGLAEFEAFFGVRNCVWLVGAVERLARDPGFAEARHVGPRGAMMRRGAPGREPLCEGLTTDFGPNINQFFTEQDVSSVAFDEGLLIDLAPWRTTTTAKSTI
jgi:hypothetical protein